MVKPVLLAATLLLATPALAQTQLEFSSEAGPALSIARTLMGEERGDPLEDDELVTIALFDLDNDGTRDIIAFADASYFCGTAGCIPRLYRLERSTGKWAELPIETPVFINGTPEQWSIGEKDASGWQTLIFSTSDIRVALTWNGEAYAN